MRWPGYLPLVFVVVVLELGKDVVTEREVQPVPLCQVQHLFARIVQDDPSFTTYENGTSAASVNAVSTGARPSWPGFAVGGPSTTLRNVANGPSTTFLCGQRPIHHVWGT
jgi:hypothetical protein